MTEEEIAIFLRLVGARQFAVDAGTASAGVTELGVATEEAGLAMAHTTRRSYLMNQALFTVRRLLYGTTLAIIGAGAAATKWGFDFLSAMQQARVALQPVSADIGGVQNELDYLFNFTKYTPFQFKDVTIAFRQMYLGMRTVGISADTVNQTLHAIVDALSATGRTSPGALNRVSVALQHMAYMGHITGQVVLQLARDGLPIYAALQSQLHLTGDQIHNIGKLGIPSLVVLQALNSYIEKTPGLMNAAHRQAVGTFHGLFTTFRDNLSQMMGAIEQGFFHRIQGDLVNMNVWFDRVSNQIRSAQSASDVIRAIDPALVPVWNQLVADLHLFWVNFSQIIGAVAQSHIVWTTLYLGLLALHGILLILTPLTGTLSAWLYIIIPLWITWKTVTIAAAIATGLQTIAEVALFGATKDLTFAQFILGVAMGRFMVMQKLAIALDWLWVTALYAWSAATGVATAAVDLLMGAVDGLTIALLLNPIGAAIVAILALTAGLVILYYKWDAFHDLVDQTWNWIMGHKLELAAAIGLAFAPLIVAYETLKHIRDIWQSLTGVWHWLFGGSGHGGVTGLPQLSNSPIYNNGAVTPSYGISNSPLPLLYPQRKSSGVAPFRLSDAMASQGGNPKRDLHVHVHINRREVARAVFEEYGTALARQ